MNKNQAFEYFKKQRKISVGQYENPARDAKLVTEYIYDKNKKHYLPFFIWRAGKQLRRGMPIAKIIGQKWFYGMRFFTNKNTLDPRPDSETLVESVIKSAKNNISPVKILDLGTGTGCLICAIVKNLPGATGIGIDISFAACRTANKNVFNLGLKSRVEIKKMDFSNLNSQIGIYDIIISNPPYIAIDDSRVNNAALFDPKISLYAGPDGLDAYRKIAKSAHKVLKKNGKLFLELGQGQVNAVCKIFSDYEFINSYQDLGGIIRVLEFKSN